MPTWTAPTLRDVLFDRARLALPTNVWPVECDVKLDRTMAEDTKLKHLGIAQAGSGSGARMFHVQQTKPTGYIWGNVFFENPMEKPRGITYKSGQTKPQVTFEWNDFVARLDEAIVHLMSLENRGAGHDMPDQRLYIRGLRLVEIPNQYVSSGKVDRRFYDDHAEFGEAIFNTSSVVKTGNPRVKRALGGGLPGRTLLPMEMVHARKLFAKRAHKATHRYAYWTRSKTKKQKKRRCGDCGRTWSQHEPKEFDEKKLANWKKQTLQTDFPDLAVSGLLGIVEYTGTQTQRTQNTPQSARWL